MQIALQHLKTKSGLEFPTENQLKKFSTKMQPEYAFVTGLSSYEQRARNRVGFADDGVHDKAHPMMPPDQIRKARFFINCL